MKHLDEKWPQRTKVELIQTWKNLLWVGQFHPNFQDSSKCYWKTVIASLNVVPLVIWIPLLTVAIIMNNIICMSLFIFVCILSFKMLKYPPSFILGLGRLWQSSCISGDQSLWLLHPSGNCCEHSRLETKHLKKTIFARSNFLLKLTHLPQYVINLPCYN